MESDSDQYSLVIIKRYHLGAGQKWRLIDKFEEGQAQTEISQNLNISQNVVSRA